MWIYLIECLVNGKVYIGRNRSDNPYRRWHGHKGAATMGNGQCIVDRAIIKYGADQFIYTPIEHHSTLEEMNQSERYWIGYLREVLGKHMVYNVLDGGEGPQLSEEQKVALRKLSPETEEEVVKDYATGNYSHRTLGVKYGVSKFIIGAILKRKAFECDVREKWTKDEVEYLGEWFDRLTIAEIAKAIGRTYGAVAGKIKRLQLQ